MGALFFKECKTISRSLVFWLFIIITAFFMYSQTPTLMEKKLEKPEPGQASYGMETKFVENPQQIMPEAINGLLQAYPHNSFTTYPTGFMKTVKLNDEKREKMAEILSQLTTYSKEELLKMNGQERSESEMAELDSASFDPAVMKQKQIEKTRALMQPSLRYEAFKALMVQADELLGGGSDYNPEGASYKNTFGQVSITYEDALKSYNDIVEKDKVSGAYARMMSDYLLLMLGILPVFVAVAIGMRDSRARMKPQIYTRKISSLRLALVRYSSLLFMLFVPVLVIALVAQARLFITYRGSGLPFDQLAFLKYAVIWLLPTLMMSSSIGFFLTELTDSPIAIVVQGFWWFMMFSSGGRGIQGGHYNWALMPRHNALGNTQLYLDGFSQLMKNRLLYAALSMVLVLLTIGILELKRRGRLDVWRSLRAMLAHRKVKS